MSKQGTLHCFINYELQTYENEKSITTYSTFHLSVKATEEKQLKTIGTVCSALLFQMGIKHTVNYDYKPAWDNNYFVNSTSLEEIKCL